jgi:hypothetical protein
LAKIFFLNKNKKIKTNKKSILEKKNMQKKKGNKGAKKKHVGKATVHWRNTVAIHNVIF